MRKPAVAKKKTKRVQTKQHECQLCFEVFQYPYLLKKHLLSHTGEKQHKCELCGKGFDFPYLLKRHMASHMGLKPYSCSECGKRFTTYYCMKMHTDTMHSADSAPEKSSHSADSAREKSFVCDMCGVEFKQASSQALHMKHCVRRTNYLI